MKKLFVLGVVLTLFAATAPAQRAADRMRHQRIERGFDNGQITRHEKMRLHRNETRLRVEKRRVLRDGRITPREKRRLAKMKRAGRHQIYRLKHNSRRRFI